MRNRLMRGCLLFLLAFAGTAVSLPAAVLSGFTERVWHVRDGLPDQVVQAIAQTPDHYLWIGTSTGLIRFDGRNFVPYSGEGEDALRSGVTSLLVTRDQSLFIGTEGSGLLCYRNGKMRVFGAESGLRNPMVRSLLEDSSGTLWIGADRALYRWNGNGVDRVQLLQKFPDIGATAILQQRSGAIWYGDSKLVRVGKDATTEYVLPLQNGSMRIKALGLGADGSIWAGTVAGLFHQMPSGQFAKVPEVHGTVRTFGRFPSGEMWVGTVGNGVYVQTQVGFVHIGAHGALPSNTILCQTTDSEGNVWIGTQSGLLRFSPSGMELAPLPDGLDADFGTIMRDSDGSLWICSSHLFHVVNGQIARYHFAALPDVMVRTMLRERSGALWIGTAGRGAYRIAPGGRIEHYTDQIGTNFIRGFMQARDGSVWIATDGGASRYRNGHIDNYHEIADSPKTFVLSLAEGTDGQTWIGTHRGLMVLDNGEYHQPPVVSGLRNQSVWTLHTDSSGALWIGADSGLYRLKNGTLYHFAAETAGMITGVYKILEDAKALWISGPTRVVRFPRGALDQVADGATSSPPNYEAFPVSNEIQSAELYGGMQPTALLDSDGTAWFASSQGPIHIIPGQKPANTTVPLAVNEVLVDGRHTGTASLALPPGTKTLEIDFSPILLSPQTDLRFRHKLEGFDDWSPPSSSRSAIYTNLPAGQYTFRVQALSNDAVGGISDLSLPLQQRARFYRRAWFWWLCALGILGIVWSIYRLRVRRIAMRFRAIAEERNRLAREMHDTVIQGCAGVSALLEAFASTTTSPEPSLALLNYAREQLRVTMDQARDAVWDLRGNELQPLDLRTSLVTLLDRHVKAAGLDTNFDCEGIETTLDNTVVYELLMSTREALLNASTHSSATRVSLKLAFSLSELLVSVSDNGEGFCVEEAMAPGNRHYGLKGMRERMESVGGKLHLGSSLGGGTRLVFRIPLKGALPRTQAAMGGVR